MPVQALTDVGSPSYLNYCCLRDSSQSSHTHRDVTVQTHPGQHPQLYFTPNQLASSHSSCSAPFLWRTCISTEGCVPAAHWYSALQPGGEGSKPGPVSRGRLRHAQAPGLLGQWSRPRFFGYLITGPDTVQSTGEQLLN